jgi:hypothetical protein
LGVRIQIRNWFQIWAKLPLQTAKDPGDRDGWGGRRKLPLVLQQAGKRTKLDGLRANNRGFLWNWWRELDRGRERYVFGFGAFLFLGDQSPPMFFFLPSTEFPLPVSTTISPEMKVDIKVLRGDTLKSSN